MRATSTGCATVAVACRGRSPADIAQVIRDARRAARKAEARPARTRHRPGGRGDQAEADAVPGRHHARHEAGHAIVALELGIDLGTSTLDAGANCIHLPGGVHTRAAS